MVSLGLGLDDVVPAVSETAAPAAAAATGSDADMPPLEEAGNAGAAGDSKMEEVD